MSPPQLELDYIGLSEASDKFSSSASDDGGGGVTPPQLNLKETELRLALPGSESPERRPLGLTLGLPTSKPSAKRGFADAIDGKWSFAAAAASSDAEANKGALFSPRGEKAGVGKDDAAAASDKKPVPAAGNGIAPAAKAQVVGWPPIRSYRKNTMATNPMRNKEDAEGKQGTGCLYIKVSMDGAPYLRKVDLKTYSNYKELSSALEKMFSCFTLGQCGSHGMPGRDGLTETYLMDLLHGSECVLTYEDKDGDWMLVGDVPWEMFTDSCRRLRIMKGSDAIGLAPRAMQKCKSRN